MQIFVSYRWGCRGQLWHSNAELRVEHEPYGLSDIEELEGRLLDIHYGRIEVDHQKYGLDSMPLKTDLFVRISNWQKFAIPDPTELVQPIIDRKIET